MKATITIVGTLALAVIGCTGDFQSGGGGQLPSTPDASVDTTPDATVEEVLSTGQALFEANVRPIIIANCSPGGACHSAQDPAFVSSSTIPGEAYNLVQSYKDRLYPNFESAGSAILAYGDGAHKAQATFTTDDTIAVQGWLATEKIETDANAPDATAMQIWSGCMNLDDWDNENVASAWANKNAGNQGDCDACHNLGGDGFMASDDSARVFETITTNPSLMPSYFTLNATGTTVLINRARLENVGTLQEPHQGHGAFNVDGGAMEALQRFYEKTNERLANGQCDLPRY